MLFDRPATAYHRCRFSGKLDARPRCYDHSAVDTLSQAILETIGNAGYVVTVGANDVTAHDEAHHYMIRFRDDDLYAAAVRLAV